MKRLMQIVSVLGLFFLVQLAQAQWTASRRITWTSGDSKAPSIAVDSSNYLHVVWYDDTPGTDEIYYKKSTNGGGSWMASRRLTVTGGSSRFPAIAADSSGNIHVVWEDDTPGSPEIYYRKSTNGGTSWTISQRLTWNLSGSGRPAIAADSSGNIHVVWEDETPGNAEIYYRKSTNGGTSWTASRRLTWTADQSEGPDIVVDSSGKLHVVWHDITPGNREIYYKKSTNGGATWTASRRVTWTAGDSENPAVAVDSSGNPHLVWWEGLPGNWEIYYRKSTNGGTSWMTSQRLTWNSGASVLPALIIDSTGRLHVVWYDDTPGGQEIYYRKSTNGGTSWMTSQRLSWTPGASLAPDIAADSSGDLHVVWHDLTHFYAEIYYKKYIR